MTATLKHTTQGYVLIVDERPSIGDWSYNFDNTFLYGDKKIIAAENLEGVKGIRIEHNNHLLQSKSKRVHEILDGKEVEATEHEEYWVVEL